MKCLVLSLVFFSVGRSKGNKQEAEMMKTEEESTLQVTFSTHLFASPRKASELCTHFDSETTVFVNTPAEKCYHLCELHIQLKQKLHRLEAQKEYSEAFSQLRKASRHDV
ncbi:hypothetical protein CK203_016215 [Vitis vinifera]|uniref:Uncharacterized protein n=1 Tax=Vitis vinifera TaxID=29760 RepID=A0A438JN20_VITVI|nr:hypothetical protein CK203_016215 [Vitis vinifera]